MDSQTAKTDQTCPREEIALYLDGELSLADELMLESHLADCQACRTEVNLHKQMFSVLDLAFEASQEVEIPENFAKVVAAKAESKVSGLRSKEERSRALTICLGLTFLTLIGLAFESDRILGALAMFSGQIVAVVTICLHLISDFAIGLAIISRSISQKIVFSSMFPIVLAGALIVLMTIIFSRLRLRFNRS
jgi:anti-sigma factor RsiW